MSDAAYQAPRETARPAGVSQPVQRKTTAEPHRAQRSPSANQTVESLLYLLDLPSQSVWSTAGRSAPGPPRVSRWERLKEGFDLNKVVMLFGNGVALLVRCGDDGDHHGAKGVAGAG